GTLAPGFVDLQVNGGGDVMLNAQPTPDAVERIVAAHRGKGTTALLPTVISDTRQVQAEAVEAVRAARAAGNASVLGIHIEGPFFAANRRGAHRGDHIRRATADDIAWLCSLDEFPVVLTLAPEQFDGEQLRTLADSGLVLCAGHTDSSYAQMREACDNGISGVTHLFNAMTPLQSREPGAVGAALDLDALWAGLIADGHHVHPAAIRLAHRVKPDGRLILVSDAMGTVGGTRGSCEIYGETVQEQAGRLVNGEGRLAGSAIGMIDAVRYAHEEAGIALSDCLRMASSHPAAIIGLAHRIGSLTPGCRADIVHFDEAFTVHNTWVAGERANHRTLLT
ncbi:MAG: N-acetylglucosamine-6-phosphate deacetylase, partial [Halioglobus sp.]|nr:N-acetylglucosamine-6-phosphate deacetylase [Halioglobus sp.]